MIKRIVLFGFGALISIFFLSLGPENRLKNTFYAYIDYFNINKRVIYHLKKDHPFFSTTAECQLIFFDIDKSYVLSVLDGGEVNFSKSNKKQEPCQLYLIENQIKEDFFEVMFEYCSKTKKVTVMNISLNNSEVCKN